MTLSWWNRLRMCIPIQWSWPVEVVDLPVGDEIRGAHLVVDAVGQHCTNHTATRTASSAPISKYQWTEESKKKKEERKSGEHGGHARVRVERISAAAPGSAPPMEKPLLSNSARISSSIASAASRVTVVCLGRRGLDSGGERKRERERRAGIWGRREDLAGTGVRPRTKMAGKFLRVRANPR